MSTENDLDSGFFLNCFLQLQKVSFLGIFDNSTIFVGTFLESSMQSDFDTNI